MGDSKQTATLKQHLRHLGVMLPAVTPAATNRAVLDYNAATGEPVTETVRRAAAGLQINGALHPHVRALAGLFSYLDMPVSEEILEGTRTTRDHSELIAILVDAMASDGLAGPAAAPSLIRLCFAAGQYRKALALSREVGSDIGVAAAAGRLASIAVFRRVWLQNCLPAVKLCRRLTGLTGTARSLGGRYLEHYVVLAALGPFVEQADLAILAEADGLQKYVTDRANLSWHKAQTLAAAIQSWKADADVHEMENWEPDDDPLDHIDYVLSEEGEGGAVSGLLKAYSEDILEDIERRLSFVELEAERLSTEALQRFEEFQVKRRYRHLTLWLDPTTSAPLIHDATHQIAGTPYRDYFDVTNASIVRVPLAQFGQLKSASMAWEEFRVLADGYLKSRAQLSEDIVDHGFTFERARQIIDALDTSAEEDPET